MKTRRFLSIKDHHTEGMGEGCQRRAKLGYTNIKETVLVHEAALSAEESTSASVRNMCYHMLNLSGK